MPDNEINGDSAEMNESDSLIGASGSADDQEILAESNASEETPDIAEPSMKDPSSSEEGGGEQAELTPEEAEMMAQMNQEAGSAKTESAKVSAVEFEQFSRPSQPGTSHNIDMLLDVAMPISIELGRTSMAIQDILNLGPGSVVELNKLAGEPVDLLVNEKLIARGEVVVVDENFGIRITSMTSQEERIKSLG